MVLAASIDNLVKEFQTRRRQYRQYKPDRHSGLPEPRFSGELIGITGRDPLDPELLRQEIILAGGVALIVEARIWQPEQIIVVGREDFDEAYLKQTVKVGLAGIGREREYRFAYLAQEDFAEWWIHEECPAYYHGDPRIATHPGLAFLAAIGFQWPATAGGPGWGTPGGALGLQEVHPLAAVYHYSVRQEVRIEDRRAALQRAIRPDGLGLKVVAAHIAGMVRLNKARLDNRMEGAIARWEADLAWLYHAYYKHSIYRFIWPEY